LQTGNKSVQLPVAAMRPQNSQIFYLWVFGSTRLTKELLRLANLISLYEPCLPHPAPFADNSYGPGNCFRCRKPGLVAVGKSHPLHRIICIMNRLKEELRKDIFSWH